MLHKKLTREQIEQLYAFTEKHYIEYYDLQTELVDHLANAIEQHWHEEPNVPFEEALQAEFKKFGIFGFTELAERRKLALTKKYDRLLWLYYRNFLKLPKVLLTIMFFITVISLFKQNEIWMNLLPFACLIVFIVRVIQLRLRYRRKVRSTGKKWLFEHVMFNFVGIGLPTVLPFQLAQFYCQYRYPDFLLWLNAIYFTAMMMYYYVMFFVVPLHSEGHLRETYPEYAFEN